MQADDSRNILDNIEKDPILYRKYIFSCRVAGTKSLLITLCVRCNIKGRSKKYFQDGQILTLLECVGPSSLMGHLHQKITGENLLNSSMGIIFEQKYDKTNFYQSKEIFEFLSSDVTIEKTPAHLRRYQNKFDQLLKKTFSDDGEEKNFRSFSQTIDIKEEASSWINTFLQKSAKILSKIPYEGAKKIGEIDLVSTLDDEKTCEIVCKKIAVESEKIEVLLLESEVAATAKAFILHKYKLNQDEHEKILLFYETGEPVEDFSPVKKNQTYLFGFVNTIIKWAEENPDIYKIIKKNNLDERGYAVCTLAMMNFNKELAMILTKTEEMKSLLVALKINVVFSAVLKSDLEEFSKK